MMRSKIFFFLQKLICPDDGYVFPEIEPRLFLLILPYGHVRRVMVLVQNIFGTDICETCGGARLVKNL